MEGVVRKADVRTVAVEELEVEEVEAIEEKERDAEAREEFRLAWMWVEGWRGRLRGAGDIIEKARYDWSDGRAKKLYVCL